jgi:hypothetical protein
VGFWSDYKKSLKPLAVEEPIDVWVHRPLAYVLAKALYPTPVSPNAVTLGSILLGGIAGYAFLVPQPHHMQVGAGALFLSAVLDCADGQLARLRKSSSALGRMLDGVADLVVAVAAVGGGVWHVVTSTPGPTWLQGLVLAACAATIVTGSFHTSCYDHYKNIYLRLTSPHFREGEDYETALARYRARSPGEFGVAARLAWPIYLFYVKSQRDYVRRFDPHTFVRLSALPEFDEQRAEVYRAHADPPMRIWRGGFGFGSLVFGIALSAALDVLLPYMLLRLVVQNAVFYGYLRPLQRRASGEAFRALGLAP